MLRVHQSIQRSSARRRESKKTQGKNRAGWNGVSRAWVESVESASARTIACDSHTNLRQAFVQAQPSSPNCRLSLFPTLLSKSNLLASTGRACRCGGVAWLNISRSCAIQLLPDLFSSSSSAQILSHVQREYSGLTSREKDWKYHLQCRMSLRQLTNKVRIFAEAG